MQTLGNKITALFGLILLLLFSTQTFAQDEAEKKRLENERNALLKRIKETNSIIKQTRASKSRQYQRLRETRSQIQQRRKLLKILTRETEILDQEIELSTQIIDALKADEARLQEEYGRMLVVAYKSEPPLQQLARLFAAQSFSEFLARWQLFQRYSEVRREQLEGIQETQQDLKVQIEKFEAQKQEKQRLKQEAEAKAKELQTLSQEQRGLISQLKRRENSMRAELLQKRKALQELEKLIAAHIRSATFSASLSKEQKMISSAFAKKKGAITWPVKRGFISSSFGEQKIEDTPGMKDIKIVNLGIDIRTPANEKVYCVFAGTVMDVSEIKGRGAMVIIQHGDYFSVYTKLRDVNLKPGQKVRGQQAIGRVAQISGLHEVEFQIWRHQERQDPAEWLKGN